MKMKSVPVLASSILALLGGALLSVAPAVACSVPVFRYALERWPVDDYLAVVFHSGPLTEEGKRIVRRLKGQSEETLVRVNLSVKTADLARLEEDPLRDLWDSIPEANPPWIVLLYGPESAAQGVAWSGALSEANAASILDSPARRTIFERLLAGDSAVWLLLESGDAAKSDAARERLSATLDAMEREMQLPEIAPEDREILWGDEEAGPPLRIDFSTVRVNRADPAEEVLASTLLRSEPDLLDDAFTSEPMVFPIYGRGHALYALAGKGITEANLLMAGQFITGPCSCEIKALNPGFDLLMRNDWDDFLGASAIPSMELQYLANRSQAAGQRPEGGGIAPVETAGSAPSRRSDERPLARSPVARSVLATVAVLFLATGVCSFFFVRKRSVKD